MFALIVFRDGFTTRITSVVGPFKTRQDAAKFAIDGGLMSWIIRPLVNAGE